jgi:hypothetical protein
MIDVYEHAKVHDPNDADLYVYITLFIILERIGCIVFY